MAPSRASKFSCLRSLKVAAVWVLRQNPLKKNLISDITLQTPMGFIDWSVATSRSIKGRWRLKFETENQENVARIHSLVTAVLKEMHRENVESRFSRQFLMRDDFYAQEENLQLDSNLQMAFVWWVSDGKHGYPVNHATISYTLPIAPTALFFMEKLYSAFEKLSPEATAHLNSQTQFTRASYTPVELAQNSAPEDSNLDVDLRKLSDIKAAQGTFFPSLDDSFVFQLSDQEWDKMTAANGFSSLFAYKRWLVRPLEKNLER